LGLGSSRLGGAVVTKDAPAGSIVTGNPAIRQSSFDQT
jgi:acetyltransferase-like isoleucine patch superfamily enzyme